MDAREELGVLRQLLESLKSGTMKLYQNGQDVTQRELKKLRPDVAYLETVLARRAQEHHS
ncbi:MAG: hypothetical protein ACREE4_17765 [Stellaceae bacterium]